MCQWFLHEHRYRYYVHTLKFLNLYKILHKMIGESGQWGGPSVGHETNKGLQHLDVLSNEFEVNARADAMLTIETFISHLVE